MKTNRNFMSQYASRKLRGVMTYCYIQHYTSLKVTVLTWNTFRICQKLYGFLVFRKDLFEAKHETQSVFKFSDVLFALKSDGRFGSG